MVLGGVPSRHVRGQCFPVRGTVLASISGSFDIGHGPFTPPTRSLLTPDAAQERLAAAPDDRPSPRRAEGVVAFVNTMLNRVAQHCQAG